MSHLSIDGFQEARDARSRLVRTSVQDICTRVEALGNMPQQHIVCGMHGGLPFDCLMTDICSGCMPIHRICYGNCSAAEFWISKGRNFGKPVLNLYDDRLFAASVLQLPQSQRWLRQGWVSDCSLSQESWKIAAECATLLKAYDISLMIITKCHSEPPDEILKCLALSNAEIRVSLSAFDTLAELSRRIGLLNQFRKLRGKSVPYLMTARFLDPCLTRNQEALVGWIAINDMIAGEHPLRFSSDNQILGTLAPDGFWHPKFTDQYWFGRLYDDHANFLLPPPTYLSPIYTLEYRTATEAKGQRIAGLDGNLPTFMQLRSGKTTVAGNLFKHATYETRQN